MNGNNMLTLATVGQVDVFIIFLQHAIPVAIHTTAIACFFVLNISWKNEKATKPRAAENVWCSIRGHGMVHIFIYKNL